MRKLQLAAALVAGTILGACAIGGADGFDLSGLGKIGALVEKIQHGTEEGLETATESVAIAIDRYCQLVPASVRSRARDMVNAETNDGDIVITCTRDGPQ